MTRKKRNARKTTPERTEAAAVDTDGEAHLLSSLNDEEFGRVWEANRIRRELGESVLERRLDVGLSQRELAERLGTSQNRVYLLENGEANPTIETLERLAEVLDLELEVRLVEPEIADDGPKGISLTITGDDAECESCGEELWIGEAVCPSCNTPREPGTEADAHIYRAKVAVFGQIAEEMRAPLDGEATVPLSDWQYRTFLVDSRVLDAELPKRIIEAINRLDLSTPESIRSADSRQVVQEVLQGVRRLRRNIRNLRSLKPSDRSRGIHSHLLKTFEAYHRGFQEVAETLVAWSPDEIRSHATRIQPAFDEAAAEVRLVSREMDAAFPEGRIEDSGEERIMSFVLGTLEGEPKELADVLSLGLGSVDAFMSRGPEGYAYFSHLLSTPLEKLPEGIPQTLYLLALMLSGQEDPAGVLDRASLFLEVLNRALGEEREAMLEAAIRVQDDLNEAASVLLTLAPQVDRILSTPDLPEDALRDFIVQTYGRLTEGCFKRVANLLLFAMFTAKGSPKEWEDVSDWAQFGEKYQWLANASDEPAFRTALEGVETIVRNSDAHSDVHFLEDGVRFVQTDFRSRTKEERTFTDEELGQLVADLTRTVLSLSIATQLFQTDNIREISGDLFNVGTPRGLRDFYLELFLAVTGLLEPELSEEGPLLTIRASAPPYQPPAAISEYVKSLFFVRELRPEAEELALEVRWRGEWHCSVRSPVRRLDVFKGSPEHLAVPRVLALLLSSAASSVALPERSVEEKMTDLGFGIGCANVYRYLAETMRVIETRWSESMPRILEALDYLEETREAVKIPSGLSRETEGRREELLRAIGDVEHLYRTLLRVFRSVLDSQAIGRAERRYNRGAAKIERLAKAFPFSERLF